MSFQAQKNDNDEMSEINMTPLVDVMLVLLILFIVTMPVLTQEVRVTLPKTDQQAAITPPKDPINLTVLADGTVQWNGEKTSADQLLQKLDDAARQTPQPVIQLYGDQSAAYGKVMTVLSAAKQAGITSIGFVTEPTSSP
ncbi:ExbD/TolR family protein [Halothiobacillus sp. DCM-1]|uniref:ExbD/TolR family protein n=1 Tax=Halothiobacillus sp. DCM-1 TaxID=3112558 RepID=UPI003252C5E2